MRRIVILFTGAILMTCLVLSAPADATTTTALWHMDETSGTTAFDSSGNNNNGALTSVALSSPGFDGTGRAYSFNGTSSKVLVPDSASLNPGSSSISVTVHVKFTVKPPPGVGDYDLVRKGKSIYYKIEITNLGKARCQFHGSTASRGLVFGPDLSNGVWHTITCTKTGTQIIGVVDGTITASRTVTIGSISNTTSLSLGGKCRGEPGPVQGFDGRGQRRHRVGRLGVQVATIPDHTAPTVLAERFAKNDMTLRNATSAGDSAVRGLTSHSRVDRVSSAPDETCSRASVLSVRASIQAFSGMHRSSAAL